MRVVADGVTAGPPVAAERPLVDVGPAVADRIDVVLTVDVEAVAHIDVTCVDIDIADVRAVTVDKIGAVANVRLIADVDPVTNLGPITDIDAVTTNPGLVADIRPVSDVLVPDTRSCAGASSRQVQEIAEFICRRPTRGTRTPAAADPRPIPDAHVRSIANADTRSVTTTEFRALATTDVRAITTADLRPVAATDVRAITTADFGLRSTADAWSSCC
jgi:hypothetical protein